MMEIIIPCLQANLVRLSSFVLLDPAVQLHLQLRNISNYFTMAAHILSWMKNDGMGGRVYSPTDVTSYECEVGTRRYTSALCSPSWLSLGTAQVRRGFTTKDTSVCRVICAAICRPYSTTNKSEVWALQRTKKPVGLRASVSPNHKVQ